MSSAYTEIFILLLYTVMDTNFCPNQSNWLFKVEYFGLIRVENFGITLLYATQFPLQLSVDGFLKKCCTLIFSLYRNHFRYTFDENVQNSSDIWIPHFAETNAETHHDEFPQLELPRQLFERFVLNKYQNSKASQIVQIITKRRQFLPQSVSF